MPASYARAVRYQAISSLRNQLTIRSLSIRVADEAQTRTALAHRVRRALGLDPVLLQSGERPVEVIDADGDVPVVKELGAAPAARLSSTSLHARGW
jgi:hypothetical protein